MPFMLRTSLLLATMLATLPSTLAFAANPLLTPSSLPYQAPRFDLLKDGDYLPAIEQGMAEQRAEIARIANTKAPPTFDNVIAAWERSGRLLDRATSTFFNLLSANGNDTLQKVQSAIAPKLAAHQDAINLDPRLFARVKALWDRRASLKLSPEQAMLLETYHQTMVHAGAMLSAADQVRLRSLNSQLSTLETDFQQKLLAGTKVGGLTVADKAKLDGLSAAELAAAAQDATARGQAGKFLLPLQNTTQQPALGSLKDRDTRRALFEQSWPPQPSSASSGRLWPPPKPAKRRTSRR
jgi:peptidyl-dipeptidase Dcp